MNTPDMSNFPRNDEQDEPQELPIPQETRKQLRKLWDTFEYSELSEYHPLRYYLDDFEREYYEVKVPKGLWDRIQDPIFWNYSRRDLMDNIDEIMFTEELFPTGVVIPIGTNEGDTIHSYRARTNDPHDAIEFVVVSAFGHILAILVLGDAEGGPTYPVAYGWNLNERDYSHIKLSDPVCHGMIEAIVKREKELAE